MKKVLIVIITVVFTQNVSAQLFSKERVPYQPNIDKSRLSWGYYLGISSYDFNFDYKATASQDDILVDDGLTNVGFNVGLIGNLRINDYLDLRLEPGVVFNNRNLNFTGPDFTENRDSFREIKSTYIHIPLLLKISTKRLNNFKPFIVGGIATAINLSSNEKNPDDNSVGQFRTKTNVSFYELGFGVDFYLYYFKFTPSIRGVFAMNDELVRDNDPNSKWTGTIDKMSTRGIFLNFTFQ